MPKPMKIYYDTEFHEDGKTIDLISIGMVREDGKEFYAVSSEADYRRIVKNEWLMENVMSSIEHEVISVYEGFGATDHTLAITDAAAMTRAEIKKGILEFTSGIWPNFIGWYSSYDHVVLCQLFGKMIDLPDHFPMFTTDLKQEQKQLGIPNDDLPKQATGKHNALEDARWTRDVGRYLESVREKEV